MTIVAYIFLAKDKGHRLSIADQQQQLEDFAGSQGLGSVDEVFIEQSGPLSTPFSLRPQGQRICDGVQPGDCVLAVKTEWVVGTATAAAQLFSFFAEKDISLRCVDFGGEMVQAEERRLVIWTGWSEMVRKIVEALAVCERDALGEDDDLEPGAAKEYAGGPVPFGYLVNQRGRLVVDEDQQKIIETMFILREEKRSFRWISAHLETEYNLNITAEGVRKLLLREQKRSRE